MGDFMSQRHADAAKIRLKIRFWIKKWFLQNRYGEVNAVVHHIVKCIDFTCCTVLPGIPADRLSNQRILIIRSKPSQCHDIAHKGTAILRTLNDILIYIGRPGIRHTDMNGHVIQLIDCLPLSFRTHPIQIFQIFSMLCHDNIQIGPKGFLSLRIHITGCVHPAIGLAQDGFIQHFNPFFS